MQPNKYQKIFLPTRRIPQKPPISVALDRSARPASKREGSIPFSKKGNRVSIAAFALAGITQSSATSPGGITLPIIGKNPPCRLGGNYGQAEN